MTLQLSQLEQRITQYKMLKRIASSVRAADLHNLALASKMTYTNIRETKERWANLVNQGACDGFGLRRQLDLGVSSCPPFFLSKFQNLLGLGTSDKQQNVEAPGVIAMAGKFLRRERGFSHIRAPEIEDLNLGAHDIGAGHAPACCVAQAVSSIDCARSGGPGAQNAGEGCPEGVLREAVCVYTPDPVRGSVDVPLVRDCRELRGQGILLSESAGEPADRRKAL
ncbi:uncharacterized protein BDR25DRAFT_373403 [Lindgomyces ingoldianus]|uniref:Uncharacterized protein n=1 Tax=Lindgomyces ingoldianus TaxID=673940 RepID=A0ACB6QN95_9PLEO|nr:uncharacterized protein BDR25DRAFT_373403 [Lindgomyces ingoldianus]KAF2468347.1 hypothetical protein BDR25DRAFT_373403 [Lindgomyces ingoldianus]